MLAAMKLGAVIIPATRCWPATTCTTASSAAHVAPRHRPSARRRQVRRRRRATTRASPSASRADGWLRYDDADERADRLRAGRRHAGQRSAAAVLHLGHDGQAQAGAAHATQSYPVGHLSTMYWIGLQPGDVHLNISSPGWAKHAWSCFFAPWNAGRHDLRLQLRALRRAGAARRDRAAAA